MKATHVRELRVSLGGQRVGRLVSSTRGEIVFQYDPAWLSGGFDIAPYTMAFDPAPQKAAALTFDGLHGPFYDSLPDGWGLLLMDRALRQALGWSRHEITPLDRLAYMGDRSMGALVYEPELEAAPGPDQPVDLASLARTADKVLEGRPSVVLRELLIHGGSPGGARPKVTVARRTSDGACVSGFEPLQPGFEPWMIKFHAREESALAGRVEYVYSKLARASGLAMPATDLVDAGPGHEACFAVRRFDRDADARIPMLSLCAHLYATHRAPSLDYDAIMAATLRLTKNVAQVRQAFRLMVFNVVMHNRDDHTKNFAYLFRHGEWSLSPVFDLTFSRGMSNQHTSAINGSGDPTRQDVLKVAHNAHVDDPQAIIDEVIAAAGSWPALAAEHGIDGDEYRAISEAVDEMRRRIGRSPPPQVRRR